MLTLRVFVSVCTEAGRPGEVFGEGQSVVQRWRRQGYEHGGLSLLRPL